MPSHYLTRSDHLNYQKQKDMHKTLDDTPHNQDLSKFKHGIHYLLPQTHISSKSSPHESLQCLFHFLISKTALYISPNIARTITE